MNDVTITREVLFTDYSCADECRPSVSVTEGHDGRRVGLVRLRAGDIPHEERDPWVLRILAQCLLAAADEMEGGA